MKDLLVTKLLSTHTHTHTHTCSIWTIITVVGRNSLDLLCYNFHIYQPILLICGSDPSALIADVELTASRSQPIPETQYSNK